MRPDGGHDALEILPPPTPTCGTPFRNIEILTRRSFDHGAEGYRGGLKSETLLRSSAGVAYDM